MKSSIVQFLKGTSANDRNNPLNPKAEPFATIITGIIIEKYDLHHRDASWLASLLINDYRNNLVSYESVDSLLKDMDIYYHHFFDWMS